MRSYRPEELFDEHGRPAPEIRPRARGRSPHERQSARQRRPAAADLHLPDFRDYAVEVPAPGDVDAEATRVMGSSPRRDD
jgi:xylulose-5-phosphate/fructose-6-phosphate phosphoketolase